MLFVLLQVPQFILDNFIAQGVGADCNIIITQVSVKHTGECQMNGVVNAISQQYPNIL